MTTKLKTVEGFDQEEAGSSENGLPPEIPKPPIKFTADEMKVWNYVTSALHEAGLIHQTDGMLLSVICKTYSRWVQAEKELDDLIKDKGTYIAATPNGYEQPHQLFYVARNLKEELVKLLPQAALSILGFHKIVGKHKPNKEHLVEDPVAAHKSRKTKFGMKGVNGKAPGRT